jgi:hypothetical protein
MFTHNENGRSHDEPLVNRYEPQPTANDVQHKQKIPVMKAPLYDERKIDAMLCGLFQGHISPTIFGRTQRPAAAKHGPYLLPAIPRIVLLMPKAWAADGPTPLVWFDAETGVRGEGVVALMAHVCKIKPAHAHERAAHFARMLFESR